MADSLKLLFVFTVTLSSALAQCSLDDLSCCLAEFSGIITPSRGISLTEQRLAGVCTYRDESVQCMDTYLDQCTQNDTESEKQDVEDVVNRTRAFVAEICPPTSDFMMKLKAKEDCIVNSTTEFQACYNKSVVHIKFETDADELKKACCEYKELRNCAVEAVKNKCDASASELVREEVVHTNGAVLEWACSDIFNDCPNSAVTLASSAFFVLFSLSVLRFLL